MEKIILVVVLILIAFVIAIINNKKRREITVERVRIVRGDLDAFDEKACAWPEDMGEIVELRLFDTFLDGVLTVKAIKKNTMDLASMKPFIIDGEPAMQFTLPRYENLVLEPVDGVDDEPIILSYEKMLNLNAEPKQETREELIARVKAAAAATADEVVEDAENAAEKLEDAVEDLKDRIDDALDDDGSPKEK